ncbi:MAG: hypothetical protein KA314_11075 [Chloroflexi bacterium]|nr:hypothetical protein [Chloroflexota bacterium]MBP8056377.1 hypothetical protein [Chloroflexota bacterium]
MRYRRSRRKHGDKDAVSAGMMSSRPQHNSSSASLHRLPYTAPASTTNRAQRQATMLQLQQQHGNAWVQRHLADGSLQREETKPEEKKSNVASDKNDNGSFNLGQWVSGKVYDLLKKELGDEKLKAYSQQIAGKATELLLAQVKGATGEQDIIEKARMKEIAAALSQDVGQVVQSIFQSPQGKSLREALMREIKQDPGLAIVMVLLGLAAAVAANADIPKLDETFKLGAGFSATGKADLGKFREIVAKQVQVGLNFTSEYFRAGVQGSYAGEGEQQGFAAGAEAGVGSKEVEFKTDFNIFQNGEFKLHAQNALDFKKFGLTAGASFSNIKGWKGIGEFRLGEKTHYLSTKVEVAGDGKVGLFFEHKFVRDLSLLSNSLKLEGNKATMVNEAQLKNLFGVEGFNVGANLVSDLTHRSIQELGLKADLKLLGDPKDASQPTLFLRFDTAYTAGKDGQKDAATGFLFLRGQF